MNISLEGKSALIAGSTQGIGKATALEFAHLGARVVLIARDESKLKFVLNELKAISDKNHGYIVADFSDYSDLQNTISKKLITLKPIHILVNNTGGPPAGLAVDADVTAYLSAFQMHLLCNHILVKSVVEDMKKSGYGRIINVISTSVKQPLPNLGVSNTIRGAVANWSKTLANELGEFGITVNNVLPGATATQRLSAIAEKESKNSGKSVEDVIRQMGETAPLRRVAQPAEVANAICFLASPAASYISGINLPVDGGRTGCL